MNLVVPCFAKALPGLHWISHELGAREKPSKVRTEGQCLVPKVLGETLINSNGLVQ